MEGYNIVLVTILVTLLALLGSAACVIATAMWWKMRNDPNGALALGAAMAAVLAVILGWAISFLQNGTRHASIS